MMRLFYSAEKVQARYAWHSDIGDDCQGCFCAEMVQGLVCGIECSNWDASLTQGSVEHPANCAVIVNNPYVLIHFCPP